MKNTPLPQPHRVGPSEAFRLWSDLQIDLAATTNSKKGFSAETSVIYACIWESWVQWLDGQHDPVLDKAKQRWQEARQQHVQAFLAGPAPKATTRQPKDYSQMADFSRQRYWRVLRGVYAHSTMLGLRKDNPALGLSSTPRISRRSRESQVLPPFVLQWLRDLRQLRELVPQGRVGWLTARDRAAIAVLANCGLNA
jgi:site-specific recombinase XerD